MTEHSKNQSPEQAERIRITRHAVLAFSALLFLFGIIVFFDAGGIATALELSDGGINQILGGALMIVAVIDAAILPRVFDRLAAKSPTRPNSSDR